MVTFVFTGLSAIRMPTTTDGFEEDIPWEGASIVLDLRDGGSWNTHQATVPGASLEVGHGFLDPWPASFGGTTDPLGAARSSDKS